MPNFFGDSGESDSPESQKPYTIDQIIDEAEQKAGLPKGFLRALKGNESKQGQYDDKTGEVVTSPSGPRGVFQFDKPTAASLGIDRDDPYQNVYGAAVLAKKNYQALKNEFDDPADAWAATAVAHNRGLGAAKKMIVNRHLAPEGSDGYTPTKEYVDRFYKNWADYIDSAGEPQKQQEQKPADDVVKVDSKAFKNQQEAQVYAANNPPTTTQEKLPTIAPSPQEGLPEEQTLGGKMAGIGLRLGSSDSNSHPHAINRTVNATVFGQLGKLPNEDEVVDAIAEQLTPGGSKVTQKFRSETGTNLFHPRNIQPTFQPATDAVTGEQQGDGNYVSPVNISNDIVRLFNAYAGGGLTAAQAEGQKISQELQQSNSTEQADKDSYLGAARRGVAAGLVNLGEAASNVENIGDIVANNPLGQSFGNQSNIPEINERATKNQEEIEQAKKSIPQETSGARSFVSGLASGATELPGYLTDPSGGHLYQLAKDADKPITEAMFNQIPLFLGSVAGGVVGSKLEAALDGTGNTLRNEVIKRAGQFVSGGAGNAAPGVAYSLAEQRKLPSFNELAQSFVIGGALSQMHLGGEGRGEDITSKEGVSLESPIVETVDGEGNTRYLGVLKDGNRVQFAELPESHPFVQNFKKLGADTVKVSPEEFFGALNGRPTEPAKQPAKTATSQPTIRVTQGDSKLSGPAKILDSSIQERTNGRQQYNPSGIGAGDLSSELDTKFADWYEEAKHEPNNPKVKKSYNALKTELGKQFEAMRDAGMKIEVVPDNGSASSGYTAEKMMDDITNNKHLFVLSSRDVFGSGKNTDHPLYEESPYKDSNGKPMLWNDVFRAVHDTLHHTSTGMDFSGPGEWNAFLAGAQSVSPEALPALLTETQGQSSWVNAGAHVRRPDGSIPKPGDSDYKAADVFPEQKATLPPKELVDEWKNYASSKAKEAPGTPVNPTESKSRTTFSQSGEFTKQESPSRESGYKKFGTFNGQKAEILDEGTYKGKPRVTIQVEGEAGPRFASPKDVTNRYVGVSREPRKPAESESRSSISTNDADSSIQTPAQLRNYTPVRLPNGKTATVIGSAGAGKVRVRLDETNSKGQHTVATVSKSSLDVIKVPARNFGSVTQTEAPGARAEESSKAVEPVQPAVTANKVASTTQKTKPESEEKKKLNERGHKAFEDATLASIDDQRLRGEGAIGRRESREDKEGVQVLSSNGEALPKNQRFVENKSGQTLAVISASKSRNGGFNVTTRDSNGKLYSFNTERTGSKFVEDSVAAARGYSIESHPGFKSKPLAASGSNGKVSEVEPAGYKPFTDSLGRHVSRGLRSKDEVENTVKNGNFAIISGVHGDYGEGKDDTDALMKTLVDNGFKVNDASGMYQGSAEPSFFVTLDSPEQLNTIKRLGKEFGQTQVMFGKQGEYTAPYTNGPEAGKETYGKNLEMDFESPTAGYTVVHLDNGKDVSFSVHDLYDNQREETELPKSIRADIPFEKHRLPQVVVDNATKFQDGSVHSENNNGTVYLSPEAIQYVKENIPGVYNPSIDFYGAALDGPRVKKLLAGLKGSKDENIAKLYEDVSRAAGENKYSVNTVVIRPDRSVNEIISAQSHENIHATQLRQGAGELRLFNNAKSKNEFLESPAIVRWREAVRESGYGDMNADYTASEIAAHYLSGDWQHLNISDDVMLDAYMEYVKAVANENKTAKLDELAQHALLSKEYIYGEKGQPHSASDIEGRSTLAPGRALSYPSYSGRSRAEETPTEGNSGAKKSSDTNGLREELSSSTSKTTKQLFDLLTSLRGNPDAVEAMRGIIGELRQRGLSENEIFFGIHKHETGKVYPGYSPSTYKKISTDERLSTGNEDIPREKNLTPLGPIKATSSKDELNSGTPYKNLNPLAIYHASLSGKKQRIEDVAADLEERTNKAFGQLDENSSERKRLNRARAIAAAELKYQLAQEQLGKDTGRTWYKDDVAKMEKGLTQLYPELKDKPKMTLFKTAIAFTSGAAKPNENLALASEVWEATKGFTKPLPDTKESGTAWGLRPQIVKIASERLQKLISEKGVDGAAKWLLEEHPVKELRQYNSAVRGSGDTTKEGMFVFGPKYGSFGLNLHGVSDEITVDQWMMRTWRRWMGNLSSLEKIQTGSLSAAPSNQERTEIKEALGQVVKDIEKETGTKLSESEAQAMLWYYEQELWRKHGAKNQSQSYGTAIDRLIQKKSQTSLFGGAKQAGTEDGGAGQDAFAGSVRQGNVESTQASPQLASGKQLKLPTMGDESSSFNQHVIDETEKQKNLKKFLEGSVVQEPVYHGTSYDIAPGFSPKKKGQSTGLKDTEWGYFFTDDPVGANFFANFSATSKEEGPGQAFAALQHGYTIGNNGQNILPVYLSIKNPYKMDFDEWNDVTHGSGDAEKFGAKLKKQGYDGILLEGADDEAFTPVASIEGGEKVYIAFDGKQIKSATGNQGTFNPKLNDLLKSGSQTFSERQQHNKNLADFDRDTWLDTVLESAPDGTLSADKQQQFDKLIGDAQKAKASGNDKETRKSAKALLKFYSDVNAARLPELMNHVARASMLMGIQVAQRNSISNALYNTAESMARYGDWGVDWALYVTGYNKQHESPDLTSLAKADLYGLTRGVSRGVSELVKSLTKSGTSKLLDGEGLDKTVTARFAPLTPLAKIANLGYSLTEAQDKPYREFARARALYDLASIAARNYKGTKAERDAYFKDLLTNPTPQMADRAEVMSQVAVFQQQNKINTWYQRQQAEMDATAIGRGAKAALNWVQPFVKTNLNIGNAVFDYMGLRPTFQYIFSKGAKQFRTNVKAHEEAGLSFNKATREAWNELPAEQRQAVQRAFSRGLIGWGLMLFGAGLYGSGRLTPWDDNETQAYRNNVELSGAGPGHVRLNGHWFDLRYAGPIASLILAGGTWAHVSRNGDRVNGALNVLEKVMLESNPMAQTAQELLKDKNNGRIRAVLQPERFVPPVSAEAARLQDRPSIFSESGTSRDTTGDTEVSRSLNRIKARLPKTPLNPSFNRQSLPEQTDVLGRPKSDPNPLYPFAPKPVRTDKVTTEVGKFATPITRSLVKRDSSGQPTETPTQLRVRQKTEGQAMDDYLNRGIGSPGYTGNEDGSLKRLASEGRGSTKQAPLTDEEKTSNARLVVRSVEAENRTKAILSTHPELTDEQKKEVLDKVNTLFSSAKAERTKNLNLPKRLSVEADITSQLYSNPQLLNAVVEQFVLEAKSFKP